MADVNQTIKKLSEFKDAAKFERLATAYLRSFNPNKYLSTSHLGVNPKGSTVKAPLDGFSFYEEDGELGIAGLEHTTTEIKNLHDKFLKDLATVKPKNPKKGPTGNEGDLRKAIDVINTYRSKYQDIKKATVALVSTLDPKPETILEAKALAKLNNINLEVYGGTRLADYLDTTSRGQYLRKLYLDEKPDKLSLELLREISGKQINYYSKYIDTQLIVKREHNQVDFSNHKFLVGESGAGKSVIAFTALQTSFENGSAGIFLSEKLIDASSTLEEALTKQLALFESNLNNDSGAIALELCIPSSPLLIVIEDINNSDNPVKTLQRILSWIPKEQSKKWIIVCPVYPVYLDSLKHNEKTKVNELTTFVGNFSTKEAKEAIKRKMVNSGIELSAIEIESICTSLGNDPLLIALSDLDSVSTSSEIIENYITDDIQKIAASLDDLYAYEVAELFEELIRLLLNNRNFNPTISDINEWFKDSSSKLLSLKKLLKVGSAVFISNKNGNNSLFFRHDRISLTMNANVIARALNEDEKPEYICDPFYAEAVALALINNGLKQESVDFLEKTNPLSLFQAFKLSSRDSSLEISYLIERIKAWIVESNKDKLANKFIMFEAIHLLSSIDSKHVISMTELFTDNSLNEYWLEARFRNGDLKSGLNLVLRHELGTTIRGRKELFAHIFSRHGDSYSKQLKVLLSSNLKCNNTLNGSLLLAGYLGDTSLELSISESWNNVENKKQNLLSFLWAASRCHLNNETLLKEVCEQWASLSDEKEEHGSSELNSFASYGLSWAFESYVPINALAYFAKIASEDEKLEWPITYMLRVFVEPVAIQYLVEFLAKRYEKSEDNFFFVYTAFTDHLSRKNKMPEESKNLLEKIIKDENSSISMIKAATRLYGSVESKADLLFLQSFDKNEESYEWAIFERAKRGDLSVITKLLELIPSNKRYWWQAGRYLWNEDLTGYLIEAISEMANEVDDDLDHILSELLMEVEPDISSKILLDNWKHVKSRRRFLQAALYISHPKLLALVHKEVVEAKEPQEIFIHVSMAFGIRTVGRKGVTRLTQIETLWRYKQYLSEMDIYSLWDTCNRNQWIKYRRNNIDGAVPKNKYRAITSIDTKYLKDAYAENNPSSLWQVIRWFEDCIEYGFEHSNLVTSVINWFETKKDLKGFNVVGEIAMEMFTRKDMLELKRVVYEIGYLDKPFQNLDFYIKHRSLY